MFKKTTTQIDPRVDLEIYSAKNRGEQTKPVIVELSIDGRSATLPMLSGVSALTPDGKMLSAVLDLSKLDDLLKVPGLERVEAKKQSQPNLQGSRLNAIPARDVTAHELLDLLSNRSLDLYKALGLPVSHAQLSFPTDGRGVRLKVDVSPYSSRRAPAEIRLPIGNEVVRIPVESSSDFQDYRI